jgi:hypothetical protein
LAAAPVEDIVLSGYNADVVTDADPATRRAQPFDVERATYFEQGISDAGGVHPGGIPSGKTFESATGSGAKFTLRPANGPNVLRLFSASNAGLAPGDLSGTLQIKPGQYTAIAVLAASANAKPSSKATGTINYAEGEPTTFTYVAPDWDYSSTAASPTLALGDLRRNGNAGDGTGFYFQAGARFGLWETIILPENGLDSTRVVTSITFNRTNEGSGAGQPSTSIFAVSGEPIPEAASMAALFGLATVLAFTARHGRGRPQGPQGSPRESR